MRDEGNAELRQQVMCGPGCTTAVGHFRALDTRPSDSVDAASWWRSHASVPRHSGPFPGGGRSPVTAPGSFPFPLRCTLNGVVDNIDNDDEQSFHLR